MTSQRVRISCPNCCRTLWMRGENVGRRGICKHCGHMFRARAEDVAAPTRRAGGVRRSGDDDRAEGTLAMRMGLLESELRAVRSHLANQSAQHASVLHELEATRLSLVQVHDTVSHARKANRVAVAADDRDGSESEHAQDSSDGSALQVRTGDATRLESELLAERARCERLQAQILDIQSRAGVFAHREPEPPPAESNPGAAGELPAENDGHEPADGDGADPLDDGRLEAERHALTQEIDRLQNLLGELEPALEAAHAQVETERAAQEIQRQELEARRQEIEDRWAQRQQETVADAEAREFELRRARDEGLKEANERADVCQRLTADRDRMARVVRRLRGRLTDRDRVRAKLDAALAEAREQWESERRELQTQADHHLQVALDVAASGHGAELERRLAEDQAAIEEERRIAHAAEAARSALRDELESAQRQLEEARDALRQQVETADEDRAAQVASLDDARRAQSDTLRESERLSRTPDGPQDRTGADGSGDAESYRQAVQRLAAVLRQLSSAQILTNQRRNELIAQVATLRNALARRTDDGTADAAVRPCPRSDAFSDPAEYRAELSRWLNEAQERRQQVGAQIDHLDSELGSARHELGVVSHDLALGAWNQDDETDDDVADVAEAFVPLNRE